VLPVPRLHALAIRALAAVCVLVAAICAPGVAWAAGATLVIVADAAASKAAVKGLGAILPEPWRLGDDAPLRRALATAGQRTAAGVALGSKTGRDALATKARAAATEVDASAVLFVRVTATPGRRAVTLLLVSPNAVDPVLDTTVDAPTSDEGAALLEVLGPALARLAPPKPSVASDARSDVAARPPSPAAVSPPPPIVEGADRLSPPPGPGRADHTILELAAGGGTASRFFQYHDGLSPALRAYDLGAAPNLVASAEVYPFARLSIPILRGVGLAGGYQRAVGLVSETSSGMSVSTVWWRAEGDLRLRVALGPDGRHLVGLRGGVVEEHFGFTTSDASLTAQLPDVDYLFWRIGAFGRASLGPIALLVDAGYLPAIAGGPLADRFRQTFFAAVEASGGLAVPLARLFELRATATYTRVFYSFHPNPGDENVAGGALDNLVRAQLTANLRL